MAKEFGTGKVYTYLRLNAKGELYTTSKEPKEGFTEEKNKEGNVYYQKAFKSTEYGKINYFTIAEKEFPTGKVKYVELSILSDDEANIDVVQLPLKNTKGGLTDEVKKLVAVLPSIDFSKSVIISSNREKNARGYVDRVLFFRYKSEVEGETDAPIKFSLKFGPEGNVPMFVIDEDPISPGSKTYDYKDQDRFLTNVLVSEIRRFSDFKEGNVYDSEYKSVAEPQLPESTSEVKSEDKKSEPKTTKKEVVEKKDSNPFAEDDDSPF